MQMKFIVVHTMIIRQDVSNTKTLRFGLAFFGPVLYKSVLMEGKCDPNSPDSSINMGPFV
jgi:hypothetical protein